MLLSTLPGNESVLLPIKRYVLFLGQTLPLLEHDDINRISSNYLSKMFSEAESLPLE